VPRQLGKGEGAAVEAQTLDAVVDHRLVNLQAGQAIGRAPRARGVAAQLVLASNRNRIVNRVSLVWASINWGSSGTSSRIERPLVQAIDDFAEAFRVSLLMRSVTLSRFLFRLLRWPPARDSYHVASARGSGQPVDQRTRSDGRLHRTEPSLVLHVNVHVPAED